MVTALVIFKVFVPGTFIITLSVVAGGPAGVQFAAVPQALDTEPFHSKVLFFTRPTQSDGVPTVWVNRPVVLFVNVPELNTVPEAELVTSSVQTVPVRLFKLMLETFPTISPGR